MKRRDRDGIIVIVLILFLVSGGVFYERWSTTSSDALILTEATLYLHVNGDEPEILSRVRFIVKAGCPAAAFLPAGQDRGVGVAFKLDHFRNGTLWLDGFSVTDRLLMGAKEPWAQSVKQPSVWEWNDEKTLINSNVSFSKEGTDYDVSMRTTLKAVKSLDQSDIKHVNNKLVEYNGERLNMLNVAAPELMTAGVSIAEMEDNIIYAYPRN